MAFSIGIIGLPNAGKSTLFNLLTKRQVRVEPRPFTTIEPNVAQVPVPDERLKAIAALIKPEKTTPVSIEFIDIAGLVKDAHKGKGLGNQFLSHLQGCQTLLEVVRGFEAPAIEHIEKTVLPERDIEIIDRELSMKDLRLIESILPDLEKEAKTGKKETREKLSLITRALENLKKGKKIRDMDLSREEKNLLKEFNFLTLKPITYLLNKGSNPIKVPPQVQRAIDLQWETEALDLAPEERKELGLTPLLDRIIIECYNTLGLITFYTIAGFKEARAWRLKQGSSIIEAAGKVHSDFAEKFIKAEVLPFQKLAEAKSWKKAKEQGLIKTVGKDYIVEDGDIVEFKI